MTDAQAKSLACYYYIDKAKQMKNQSKNCEKKFFCFLMKEKLCQITFGSLERCQRHM